MFSILKVYDEKGDSVNNVELNKERFDSVNLPLLRQVINMYEFNRNSSTASTKTRSEVAGGGKKPWAQKHLGRARAGSSRSPIWKGGGVIFGPKPGGASCRIPKKARRIALNSAITSKMNDDEVRVIDELRFETASTKRMAQMLKNLEIDASCLIVIAKPDEVIWKSARNIQSVNVKSVVELNAYDVIGKDRLLMTQEAVNTLNNN